MGPRWRVVSLSVVLLGASSKLCAQPADGAPGPAADAAVPAANPDVEQARALFLQGVELVKRAQWAEALVAFERSAALRPHAVTTFNQGACQRALGRYTLARATLSRALDEGRAGGELPAAYAADATAFLQEIERLLVKLTLSVQPSGARLTVDGRPIVEQSAGVWIAGVAAPGAGAVAPGGVFEIVLDPGAHVLSFARAGFADAVVNRTFPPGASERLELRLDLLPARLDVRANQPGALVTFDGKDVGPTPVELRRPPGNYRVVVQKDGFEPYEAKVELRPGAQTTLEAKLSEERVPLAQRWWFWTGAVAIVATGVTLTYFLTRSDPAPAPYDGGSTGWVVSPLRF